MRHYLVLLFSLLLASACDNRINCDGYDCFTPPGTFVLQIMAKDDSRDLIYEGEYNSDSILIYYFEGDAQKAIHAVVYKDTSRQRSAIISDEIAWKSASGLKHYLLYLDYTDTDTLFLDVVSRTENCCTFHPYLSFTVNGLEIELDSETYSYILKK